MTIVKVNLHKVSADRNMEAKGGQIKIHNNVAIKDIESMDFGVPGKKGLKFTFNFVCNYEPELGKIDVYGQVIYVGDEKAVSEIVNAALHKGNIQAIKISEEINLPSPLPLPKLQSKPATEAPAEKKE